MKKTTQSSMDCVTNEMRREHKPVSGALYRSKISSDGRFRIQEGDIIMVVSESPYLTEKRYTGVQNGQSTITVLQEWMDLVILWGETAINMRGAREKLWYSCFERIRYE